jgi:hypothetical protein
MYARRTALSMTSAIVKTVTGLLVKARDSVDDRGFEILNAAPIITKLVRTSPLVPEHVFIPTSRCRFLTSG